MRLLKILITLVVSAIVAALLELPGEVIRDLYVHPIAEFIRDKSGVTMPKLETYLFTLSLSLPFWAAISAFYLYHRFCVYFIRKEVIAKHMFIIANESRPSINVVSILSILALLIFVSSVLYAECRDMLAAKIPGPSRFTEIRRLSSLALRDRALTVARDLRDLDQGYSTRRRQLESIYERDRHDFETKLAEFKDKETAFEQAIIICNQGIAPILGLTPAPPTPAPTSGGFVFSNQPSQIPSEQSTTTPASPGDCPPSRPDRPSEAKFPEVLTDPQWNASLDKKREEAAAVWEELRHRNGTYIQFLDVPENYNNPDSGLNGDAKLLEDYANKLR